MPNKEHKAFRAGAEPIADLHGSILHHSPTTPHCNNSDGMRLAARCSGRSPINARSFFLRDVAVELGAAKLVPPSAVHPAAA